MRIIVINYNKKYFDQVFKTLRMLFQNASCLCKDPPVCEIVVVRVVAGGGCCDSGPVDWPGSGEAAGPAQRPAGAAPKGCTQTSLCTGTHTFLQSLINFSPHPALKKHILET